jgi:AraC-like DNA-binding protein
VERVRRTERLDVVLLLDTQTLHPRDRAEAVVAAMRQARVPALLAHEAPAPAVHARLDLWPLGGDLSLMHRTSSGIRLTRTPAQVRSVAENRLSLTVLSPGRWSYTQLDVERVVSSDRWEVILVDQGAPYEYVRPGDGSTYAFSVDHEDLGLPPDLVRTAAGRLAGSPLEHLTAQHLMAMARVLDDVTPGPARATLGAATTEMLRALLLTAATGTLTGPAPSVDSLLARTRIYIGDHLTDHDLTPARIARMHNVSVRLLYRAWSGCDVSLANYVMAERLALARRMLAGTGPRAMTIAAIARRCGFVDTAHFSRRFRNANGLSPREFRGSVLRSYAG